MTARERIMMEDALVRDLRKWGNRTRTALRQSLQRLSIGDQVRLGRGGGYLKKSVKSRPIVRAGIAERVQISFERQGLFVEHGVGRGRKKGSSEAKRHAKPWIDSTLPPHLEDLQQLVTEHYADIVESAIFIPGVLKK